MRDLTTGPIGRHLAALAVPIAIGTLLQTTLLYVEGYFVARLGKSPLAGVSAASTAIIVAFGATQIVAVSAVTLVSHAVGRDSRDEANHMFNQSMALAVLGLILTLVLGYGLAEPYMRFVGADSATVAAGVIYLRWMIPAFALQFPLVAMGSTLRGTGIVNPTIIVQTVTAVLNAALDPILIAGVLTGHPLGLQGAGLARTLAIFVAVALMAFYFWRLERYVTFDFSRWRPDPATWKRMLVIGLPAGTEFAVIAVFITVVYWTLRDFGAAAQAGFGLGSRLQQGLFNPLMAITFPAAAIAGQNFGAGNAERVRRTFKATATTVCALSAIMALVFQLESEQLASFYTGIPEIVEVAARYMRITSWNYLLLGVVFTCSSLFQGMGNTWPSLATSGWRTLTFWLPALWLKGRADFRVVHVWYLMTVSVILDALFALWLLRREYRRRLPFARYKGYATHGP